MGRPKKGIFKTLFILGGLIAASGCVAGFFDGRLFGLLPGGVLLVIVSWVGSLLFPDE